MKFITSNPGSPFWDLGVKFLEESLKRHGHELIVYTGGFSNAIRSATEDKLGLFLYLAPWTLVKDNLDTLKGAPISRKCPLGVQAISEMAENYSVLFPELESRLNKKDNWFGTQFLLTNTKWLTGLKEFSEFELNESFAHIQNVPTSVFTQPNQYTWPVYENEMLYTCFDFAMGSAIVNCWNRRANLNK